MIETAKFTKLYRILTDRQGQQDLSLLEQHLIEHTLKMANEMNVVERGMEQSDMKYLMESNYPKDAMEYEFTKIAYLVGKGIYGKVIKCSAYKVTLRFPDGREGSYRTRDIQRLAFEDLRVRYYLHYVVTMQRCILSNGE